jgi:hypothetical protein
MCLQGATAKQEINMSTPIVVESDLLSRLKPLCLAEDEHTRYPALKAPVSYTYKGTRYLVATDGTLAVFIASDIEAPACPANFDVIFQKYDSSRDQIINLIALREFAGKVELEPKAVTCSKCDGLGYCSHCTEDCSDCDGEGTITPARPKQRPCFIGDTAVDLRLLAKCLSVIESSTAEICLNQDEPLFLHGTDWWVVVMPMHSISKDQDIPRFEIEKA